MLTDAREMNQLMLNYPNFAYQQENADWLNKAFLAVQSWENALEACFVSRTKSHTMIQVERQLREEYRPELRRRVELLLKLAGAGITAPEDDSLANEIAACCASLQKNREKMRSTVMREATDETITVLCEIRDHLNADSVLSCGTSLRSLRASYLPMVQTLTEKYVQYEARGMSGSDIRSAMEETENVMKNVVPSALRRLRDELNSGTAIDLETQATALKQKLEMDGLLSNASGVNAH